MRRLPSLAAVVRPHVTAAVVLLAALFAGRAAHAGSVTDCGDAQDATTTLRGVVAAAADNDYVDVSQCSTIALNSAISTALSLTIQGNPNTKTTIDAGLNDRAFVDTGASSVLALDHLIVVHGRAPGAVDPNGGCVFAAHQVTVQNSTLSDCAATSNGLMAQGGAINATIVGLTSSTIADSTASSANKDAYGGGVYAATQITCTDSVVQNDSALAGGGAPIAPFGRGGGLYSTSVSLTRCTVVGNHASYDGGGAFSTNSVYMIEGTVSGNSADYGVGGVVFAGFASITNSTIAFNHGDTCGGMSGPSGNIINSTILANNTATSPTVCHDVNAGFGPGTNNLVGVADAGVTLPADTYVGDPQLTPLAYHGGPTPTHALQATSYAVDHGNNSDGLDTDQRSTGYARVVNSIADIGAYERQVLDDEIFYSGME